MARDSLGHLREGGDRAIEGLTFRKIDAGVQFVLVIERNPIAPYQIVQRDRRKKYQKTYGGQNQTVIE